MFKNRINTAFAAALAAGLLFMAGCRTAAAPPAEAGAVPAAAAAVAASQTKPTMAKICGNCHTPKAGDLRGNFENAAFKSESMQIKIDTDTVILKFDPEELKVVLGDKTQESEALRKIKKGHEVRVEYSEKNGVKTATLVSSKPPVKLPAEKLLTTSEIEKLVSQGPEKGKYLLVDARPGPKFQEGAIPTAINIPFVAFDKMAGKLPKDKDILLIYYCGGVT